MSATNLKDRYHYYLHFLDEETEAHISSKWLAQGHTEIMAPDCSHF